MAELNSFPHQTPPASQPAASSGAGAPVHQSTQRLTLLKGDERWHFRWLPGDESSLIDMVAALARDPAKPFDWFDAAIVCKHIAQPLRSGKPSTQSPSEN